MEPIVALREALSESRARGLPFDAAWGPAVAVALRPGRLDPIELSRWAHALTVTRADWRAAYEGERPRALAVAAAAVAA